jgi:hypothetical protein
MAALLGLIEIVAGMNVLGGAFAGACMIPAGILAVINALTKNGRFASAACGLSVIAAAVCALCGQQAWIVPNIAYAICVLICCRTTETA